MSESSEGSRDPGTDPPKRPRWLRASLLTLIALVACYGAVFQGLPYLSEHYDPARVEARAIQKRAIDALQSSQPGERVAAIQQLAQVMHGDDTIVIAALIAALDDPEVAVRVAAAETLGLSAIGALRSGAGAAAVQDAVTALIRRLKDPDRSVRYAATISLFRIDSTSSAMGAPSTFDRKALMDALAGLLNDRDAKVRRAALSAYSVVPDGTMAPPEALAAALEDESAEIRKDAVFALANFHHSLEPLAPRLLQLAEHDPDPAVRGASLSLLCHATVVLRSPEVTAAVVSILTARLSSADARSRSQAAWELGEFGTAARSAIPELLRTLHEPLDPEVAAVRGPLVTLDPASEAAWTLGRITPGSAQEDEAIAALMEVALTGPVSRRGWAAFTLGEFGTAAEQAVPALIQVIHDATPDDTFKREASAAAALGRIAPGTPLADQAIEALLPLLESASALSRARAIEALGRFGPRAAAAIPGIRARRDDPDEEVREAAANALLAIDPAAEDAARDAPR